MAGPERVAVSEAARRERPRLPRELYERNGWWAAAFLLTGFAAFVGFGLLASWFVSTDTPIWLRALVTPVLVIAAAQGGHLLGFAGHEGIHLMLHRNKWVSTLLGAFASAMTTLPAIGYGVAHWNHHRYTNQASDPDALLYPRYRTFWSRLLFARRAGTRTHLRNLVLMARGQPLPLGYRLPFTLREQQLLAVLNLGFLAFWFAVYAMLAYESPKTALVAVAAPLVVLVGMSGLRGYVEHAGTSVGVLRDSRSYTHPVYTALFFGNNFHLEHHVYPGVPCYNLPRVHRILAAGRCFAGHGSEVDGSLAGPLLATTSRAQYPEPSATDLEDDPFVPLVAGETVAARGAPASRPAGAPLPS